MAKAKKPNKKSAKPTKKPSKAADKKSKPAMKAKAVKAAKPKKVMAAKPSKNKAKAAVKVKKPAAVKVGAPKEKVLKTKAVKARAPEKVEKKSRAQEEAEIVASIPLPEPPEEVVLTDAEGRRYCRVKDCDQLASVDTYCRYHYLLHWKRIQVRKKILTEGKLVRYVEELTARYPDKFLDMLRKDLKSEKEFLAAIAELEIDESATDSEFEDEQENFIDEVRGMAEPTSREEEDF